MTATLHRSADVGVVVDQGVVYLAKLPSGPIQALPGSSGLIWLECTVGDPSTVVDRVAARSAVAPEQIEDEVVGFVSELLRRGFLTEA